MRQTGSYLTDTVDPYAAIAGYYDLEHDTHTDDLPFYQHIVDMVGDPVVEFACGSGRILAALEQPGRRLTGIDNSAAMLDRCRDRFSSAVNQPDLLLQGMTTPLAERGAFGVAIIGLSSIHHLSTQDEQVAALRVAADALDPRGLLVLDLANPFDALNPDGDGFVRLETSLTTPEGRPVEKFSVRKTDAVSQSVTSTLWYDELDGSNHVLRSSTTMHMRFVYPAELELMIRAAGFHSAQLYGTYDLEPFAAESPRLIALVERSA